MLFVRLFSLCLFRFGRFPLPFGVWEGLRFVIVSLPGVFSYLFYSHQLLRACLLGSKRKLPPAACKVRHAFLCGLPSKGRAVPWHNVHMYSRSFVKRLSKRKLPPAACKVRHAFLCGLPSKGRAVPWHNVHMYSRSFVKRLSPTHFLCT